MILLHLLKSKNRVSAADLICRIEELQSTSTKVEGSLPAPAPMPPPPIVMPIKKAEVPVPVEEAVMPKPAPAPPKKAETPPVPKTPINTANQAKYDTLMRFASVELEGLLNLNKE